jgi:hypothetical protein
MFAFGEKAEVRYLFPKAKQHVSEFNLPIWFADGLKFEFSGRLKALNALAGYDSCSGVAVRRSPVNLGLGIGVPDRQYHNVSLAIVDYGFGWCTNVQGASSQRLESIDLAEVDFFSLDRR